MCQDVPTLRTWTVPGWDEMGETVQHVTTLPDWCGCRDDREIYTAPPVGALVLGAASMVVALPGIASLFSCGFCVILGWSSLRARRLSND